MLYRPRYRQDIGLGCCLVFAMSMSTVACGDGFTLDGSIGESHSLEFDSGSAQKQGEVFYLDYERGAENEELMLRLSVDTSDLNLSKNLQLTEDAFRLRVTLQRATQDGADFPSKSGGFIEFSQLKFEDGGFAEGEFAVMFINGRLLTGTFAGPINADGDGG